METMNLRTDLPGAPIWIDLSTPDAAASRTFYGELFGWAAMDPAPEYGGYFNFRAGEHLVAGCMQGEEGTASTSNGTGWMIYLCAADAEATVAAVAAAGGQVLTPAMQLHELGSMALVTDPAGAGIGIWQPGLHTGFVRDNAAGTPSWFELHTRDYDAIVGFYRDVFGWDAHTMSDTPDFRYTTYGGGERPLAGIMDATVFPQEAVAAGWSVYFKVDDADATCARIVELGGRVDSAPHDSPYGRLAEVADVHGARFKLQQL
jgi:predicted enzyme related to lactoylglutathione lyase